jgi:nicotinamide-nucleotide amidase
MKAYIINIGDEILIGQTINTNAAYIGSVLTDNHIEIKGITVVEDDINEIISELDRCWKKTNVIIVTGGLGPTHDDVTVHAVSKFFNSELVLNPEVLQDIKNRFKKLNRHMAKVNENQALVPKVAQVIRNEFGTAPGTCIEKESKLFFSLPGVPHEMKSMMQNYVIPKLLSFNPTIDYYKMKTTLLSTGIGESLLYSKMEEVVNNLNGARLAFLPSEYGTKIRISASEKTKDEALNKIQEIEQKIRALVGRYIYGKDDEELSELVGRLLNERGLRISIAESCTGGNISNLITNFNGSSNYFERGVVVYSNASKVELLHVDEDVILKHGAVSAEVAVQMAKGIRAISGSDIGLGITGILGPTGGSIEKPIGTVFISICDSQNSFVQKFNFGDDRKINKTRASQAALDYVRKYLLGIEFET